MLLFEGSESGINLVFFMDLSVTSGFGVLPIPLLARLMQSNKQAILQSTGGSDQAGLILPQVKLMEVVVMAKQGWDPNGFDYLIVDGEGHARVAGRILPERPDSTTFRWYVFRDDHHPAASGAESTHEEARQAVEQALQDRVVPIGPILERKTGSKPTRMS